MKVIVNTGPLVFLSKINRLHILQKFGTITAHRYGLNVIGTLGLLAWAKKKGFIKSFRGEILKLQKADFYATAGL
ncbi:MAG TPA: hypothetical protein DHV16_09745 [Nitrospiraceae bacterium]|nr:MAG: hypothetical protein A2Z82_04720 [Nitrospirae bacterium GWA2_46_11]OGW23712.1 MAG: hypothetical protein A2X55_06185 [Nitrospirae bacterium GWB2_47_37]HAK89119.1 hypothetical protein [Nitrospiraceae bacterium]HCL82093.1 hypothetical protein [Nitrospiraceae bacterium]HCZ12512.1 hypothetical protein [Nitrospiraceae bacterium]